MITNCSIEKFYAQNLLLNCKDCRINYTEDSLSEFAKEIINSNFTQETSASPYRCIFEKKYFQILFEVNCSIIGRVDGTNFYIDIFCNRKFNTANVVTCVQKYFDSELIEQINIERGV